MLSQDGSSSRQLKLIGLQRSGKALQSVTHRPRIKEAQTFPPFDSAAKKAVWMLPNFRFAARLIRGVVFARVQYKLPLDV